MLAVNCVVPHVKAFCNCSDSLSFNSSFNCTPDFARPCCNNMSINAPSNKDIQITRDDAAWILANAFLILTMQTGFGMLEAGSVSAKNVANIMMKNIVDVTLGGITYWSFGYALSFGDPSNWFCGLGNFFFSAHGENMGEMYTHYVFQFSFATASTTIVSGAVAERMKLKAYMMFSAINTIIYCIPASWIWNKSGFLKNLGFFDFAGACVVHLTGGASALVATIMLGPRLGRFSWAESRYGMSSPVTALTGTFMLWWAWLAFNCGSTFGIQGDLWKTAAKVGVTTLNGSIGGSFIGIILSLLMNWENKIFDIPSIITSILGGLISVTAACAVITPHEALIIGVIGGAIALLVTPLLNKAGIDDPVNAVPVHFFSSIWAIVAVGLFGQEEFSYLTTHQGIFHGGGFQLLGIQIIGMIIVAMWSMSLTALSFFVMKYAVGIRMNPQEEILGADWVEHKVRTENFATKLEKALMDMKIAHEDVDQIASKLIEELAAPNMMKVDGKIRNFAGPTDEPNVPEEIKGILMKTLTLTNKITPVKTESTKATPISGTQVEHQEEPSGNSKKVMSDSKDTREKFRVKPISHKL